MPDSYNSTPIVAPTGIMRRRMFFIVLVLLLFLAGYITAVLYNTAVVKSEYYRSKANSQQLKKYTITANRGTIYDRNNKILAQSTTVWDIVISPKSIEENDKDKKELICKTLSKLLDVDYEKILKGCENTANEY